MKKKMLKDSGCNYTSNPFKVSRTVTFNKGGKRFPEHMTAKGTSKKKA